MNVIQKFVFASITTLALGLLNQTYANTPQVTHYNNTNSVMQLVSIQTIPSGANCQVSTADQNGKAVTRTLYTMNPITLNVSRSVPLIISCAKIGFQTSNETVQLNSNGNFPSSMTIQLNWRNPNN